MSDGDEVRCAGRLFHRLAAKTRKACLPTVARSVADPGFSQRGCGTGGLGRKSPSGVQGRSPSGSLGAKPPEARDILLDS